MKIRLKNAVAAGLFGLIFFPKSGSPISAADPGIDGQILSIRERIQNKVLPEVNAGSYGDQLARLGPDAIPKLTVLTDDKTEQVRREAIEALGKIGDARAIPVFFQHLSDPGDSVAFAALTQLSSFAKSKHDTVKRYYEPAKMRPQLLRIAKDGAVASPEALFLLSGLDDKEAIPAVRAILDDRFDHPDPFGRKPGYPAYADFDPGNSRLAIIWDLPLGRLPEAGLKVLFQMGEDKAYRQVRDCLKSDSPSSRTIGLGCTIYAKRLDFAPYMLPLLSDPHEGPYYRRASGSRPRMRIEDIAAIALYEILELPIDLPPSDLSTPPRFTDDALKLVGKFSEARIKEKGIVAWQPQEARSLK